MTTSVLRTLRVLRTEGKIQFDTEKNQKDKDFSKEESLTMKILMHTHIRSDHLGQVIKGIRRMPWHWEPMKVVISCEKLRVGANIH